MRKTLTFTLLLASFSLVRADRNWFIVPGSRIDSAKSALTYTIVKIDTVWRDSSWTAKKANGQDSVVKAIRQKSIQRVVGGYAVAGLLQVDTLHSLYCIQLYTNAIQMNKLANDTTLFMWEAPDSLNRTDSTTALQRGKINRFWLRNGFKQNQINKQDWSNWKEVRKSVLKMMNMGRPDIDGTEVSKRDD